MLKKSSKHVIVLTIESLVELHISYIIVPFVSDVERDMCILSYK
jgi:hypothetical protein